MLSPRTRAEHPSPVTHNGGWDRPLPTVGLAPGGGGGHVTACRPQVSTGGGSRSWWTQGRSRERRLAGTGEDEGKRTVPVSPPKTKPDSAAQPASAAEALCPEPGRGSKTAAPRPSPRKRRLTGHPTGPAPSGHYLAPAWGHCCELARPLVARGRKGTRAFLPLCPGELPARPQGRRR